MLNPEVFTYTILALALLGAWAIWVSLRYARFRERRKFGGKLPKEPWKPFWMR